ncbi:MAG: hypothetical protein FWG67_08570 [Defluviitaleaceae bacterium]|nr:hypothetical protein [Defluviitaleaceae bacterium]
MKAILQQKLKKLISKKSTWLIIIIYLTVGIGNYWFIHSEHPWANPYFEFNTSFFEYFVLIQGGGSGFMFILLPLLVTLSTGDSFIKTRRSSILSYGLMRTNLVSYIRNEVLSTGMISFIFVALCQFLLFFFSLFFTQIAIVNAEQGMIIYAVELLNAAPLIYILLIIFNSSLMAFFFSTFTIGLSILFKSLYSAILLPYLIFIGLSEMMMTMPLITPFYGKWFYNLAPLNMVGGYIWLTFSIFAVPMYWLVLNAGAYVVVANYFKHAFRKEKLLLI